MSIFGSIMSKIFGSHGAAAANANAPPVSSTPAPDPLHRLVVSYPEHAAIRLDCGSGAPPGRGTPLASVALMK
jgi:hypothetical protein